MKSANTTLLFVGHPVLVLDHFAETLDARLQGICGPFEEYSSENKAIAAFRCPGLTVTITDNPIPLSADNFKGALDSPLSKPFIGVLSQALARHTRHMLVTVQSDPKDPAANLTMLQVAHAATTFMAERHNPAALHWGQSNQLLTGAQYLLLSGETAPWALFAKARIVNMGQPDQMVRSHGLYLDGAAEFVGQPIHFSETTQQIDVIHAASLSFLRHAVETGSPIPDGHSFGPEGGRSFLVTHLAANTDMPNGMFELSVVGDNTDEVSGDPARLPETTRNQDAKMAPPALAMAATDQPTQQERTRSVAVSYLMLVLAPPLGVFLLLTNAIFGANAWRTGFVALSSVAVALVLGAYTFLNVNVEDTAVLFDTEVIESSVLGQLSN